MDEWLNLSEQKWVNLSERHRYRIIDLSTFEGLEILSEEGAFNFKGDPERILAWTHKFIGRVLIVSRYRYMQTSQLGGAPLYGS